MNNKLTEPESIAVIDAEFEAWLRSGTATATPNSSRFLHEIIRVSAEHGNYYFICEMEDRCDWLRGNAPWYQALKAWNSLAQSRIYALKEATNDCDVIGEMWPAKELILINEEFKDLVFQRWADAGGRFYEGRMVALNEAEVWAKFSEYGCKHKPFERESITTTLGVEIDEAEALGLVEPPPRVKRSLFARLFAR